MNKFLLQKSKKILLKKINEIPQLAIITGSGIKLFNNQKPLFEIKYNALPVWRNKVKQKSSKAANHLVKGHEGLLKVYKVKGISIVVFSGRRHLYEGLNISDVIGNVRLAYELGVKRIIMTNAAGGINKNLKCGDLMLITGFINLMQATERGVLNSITTPKKRINTTLTKHINKNFRKYIKTGAYSAVLGPSYETYPEIKLLQSLGADAVGMSTIPEIICANSLGLDYAAISVISNTWDEKHKPSHKEVLKHVNNANKKLNDLLIKLLP